MPLRIGKECMHKHNIFGLQMVGKEKGALVFFANILILIVLIGSGKKIFAYRRSCWVTFENLGIFRFLRGPTGGLP